MQCPACREEMIVVEYEKIELDVCTSCRGVWFDAEELELLLGSLELSAEGLLRPPAEKSVEEVRKCPYCRRRMEKVLIGSGRGELIDRCKKGHGLWFDGGELDKVIHGLRKPQRGIAAADKGSEKIGSFLSEVLLSQEGEREKGGEK